MPPSSVPVPPGVPLLPLPSMHLLSCLLSARSWAAPDPPAAPFPIHYHTLYFYGSGISSFVHLKTHSSATSSLSLSLSLSLFLSLSLSAPPNEAQWFKKAGKGGLLNPWRVFKWRSVIYGKRDISFAIGHRWALNFYIGAQITITYHKKLV